MVSKSEARAAVVEPDTDDDDSATDVEESTTKKSIESGEKKVGHTGSSGSSGSSSAQAVSEDGNDVGSDTEEVPRHKGKPKRTKEDKERLLADMKAIEEEYALLKTKLYDHRMKKVEEYLAMAKKSILPRFLAIKRETESEVKKKLAAAEVHKHMKIINLDHHNSYATKGAQDDYENDAKMLQQRMICDLEEQLARAEKEKQEMDRPFIPEPAANDPYPTQRRASLSKKPVHFDPYRDHDTIVGRQTASNSSTYQRKRRRQTTEDPLIVYMLTDKEIRDDLNKLLKKR